MKILIVVPSTNNLKNTYREYPLGAGYIGTSLLNEGHKVMIYDQQVESNELENLLKLVLIKQFDVIAFSITTPSYHNAVNILCYLKNNNIRATFIAGGIHVTLFPKQAIIDGFDYVVCGEGESVIKDLIKAIESKSPFRKMDGVAYQKGRQVILPEHKSYARKQDIPNCVDRNLYNMVQYSHHTIITSRGCPFKCRFCCNYSKIFNSNGSFLRNEESIIEEIKYIVDTYKATHFFFADDNLFLNTNRLRKLFKLLYKSSFDISWVGQSRVDTFSSDIANEAYQSGCKCLIFGVESGSQQILNNSNKNINIGEIKKALKTASNSNIRTKTNWIYGLPGDYREQYKSVSLMLDLRPNEISIHQFIPFPGTEYYDNQKKYGIIIKDPHDFSKYYYGGINDNIEYQYLSNHELTKLFSETARILEREGYVSSDKALVDSEYVYTTPLNTNSIPVFC